MSEKRRCISCDQLVEDLDQYPFRGHHETCLLAAEWRHSELVTLKLQEEIEDLNMALDAALQNKIGDEKLINIMNRRYGREARRWEANHAQRKAERDELASIVNAAKKYRDLYPVQYMESCDSGIDLARKVLFDTIDDHIKCVNKAKLNQEKFEQDLGLK